ncbi:MAG: chorismate synthase [Oscillospiraceae bacterium]|nr:chorismate synthase [Oscillospiraceae bacterium]
MSSIYGNALKISVFGQSHASAIGVNIDGLPAGFCVDIQALEEFLARRAPGTGAWSTARKEADKPEFLCGLVDNVTCGAPLTAIIRNTNTRSQDYAPFAQIPRPAHADFTAAVKYGNHQDASGGGHFSGRLTAPLCIAGGICLQMLETTGIRVYARIRSIADITDDAPCACVAEKTFPVVTDEVGAQMQTVILDAKTDGDSVGGVIDCRIENLPAGLGEPMFGGMENRLAQILFGIPAVKGVEFGSGFAGTLLRGSENNDAFRVQDGKIVTETNHCGGILGGITNGMPVEFAVAVKPTPSIAKEQKSVDLSTMSETTLSVQGRHDPCIVPRAVPVVEAAAAIAVLDAILSQAKGESLWN